MTIQENNVLTPAEKVARGDDDILAINPEQVLELEAQGLNVDKFANSDTGIGNPEVPTPGETVGLLSPEKNELLKQQLVFVDGESMRMDREKDAAIAGPSAGI